MGSEEQHTFTPSPRTSHTTPPPSHTTPPPNTTHHATSHPRLQPRHQSPPRSRPAPAPPRTRPDQPRPAACPLLLILFFKRTSAVPSTQVSPPMSASTPPVFPDPEREAKPESTTKPYK
ncbi:hypothetical protein E2C01_035184 [Portunus trituberculatus]|uniref:Uncharacterized protein n=1 Tax=Portunus trituberculatus TaxID=210409 RepID=A0A5B7FAS2_PORTR|nr:hypothetical protein [Portunus trituberculatus]